MDARETDRRAWAEDWSEQGYELYDASGDKIGDILEVNPEYLVAQLDGGLLELLGLSEPRTLYVPREAIARDDGERWFLNVDKDRLEEQQSWTEPPATYYRSAEGGTDDGSAGQGYVADYPARDEGFQQAGGFSGRTRIVRYEEELDVDKVSRPAGEVSVGKHVVEETKTIDVPVRREEVHVERHPVGASAERTQSAESELRSGEAFQDETITVPVMEEDVEVRKVARPVEEIEVTKSQSEETRHVGDSVRREEFDIDDSTRRREEDRF